MEHTVDRDFDNVELCSVLEERTDVGEVEEMIKIILKVSEKNEKCWTRRSYKKTSFHKFLISFPLKTLHFCCGLKSLDGITKTLL